MSDIKDISTEYNDMLSALAGTSIVDKGSAPAAPAITEPPATGAVTQPVTVEVQTPIVETPTAPVADGTVPPTETKVADAAEDQTSVWDDWDASPTATPTTTPEGAVDTAVQPPTAIFTDLSKALGTEVKSADDIVKIINERSTKALESAPAELKKAIELASKGGDYLEYLRVNTVDYSKADPVELYENYIIDSSAGPDGKVDEEKVNEYLDGLSDFEKELRGKDLQKRLVNEQVRRTQELEQEAVRSREKHDSELKAALRGFTEIDGFKVDDAHRRELFEWVSTGSIMKDLFYDANGQFDAAKAAKVAFRNKYYDKLDAYHKTKIRNSTKREILKDITNQDIKNTPKFADPQPTKGYSVGDYISQLEQNFGIK